jgi:hypothetical protein
MALEAAAPDGLHSVVAPMDWVVQRDPLHVRQPDVMVVARPQAAGRWVSEPPLLAAGVLAVEQPFPVRLRATDLV